jgi:hypothetical protein
VISTIGGMFVFNHAQIKSTNSNQTTANHKTMNMDLTNESINRIDWFWNMLTIFFWTNMLTILILTYMRFNHVIWNKNINKECDCYKKNWDHDKYDHVIREEW